MPSDSDPSIAVLMADARTRLDEVIRLSKAAELCAENDAKDLSVGLLDIIITNLRQAEEIVATAMPPRRGHHGRA